MSLIMRQVVKVAFYCFPNFYKKILYVYSKFIPRIYFLLKKSFIIFLLFFGLSAKSLESTTVKIYNLFEYNCENGKLRLLKDNALYYSDFLRVGRWYSKETFYKSMNKYEIDFYNYSFGDLPISEKSFNSLLTSKEDSDGIFDEAIQDVDCSNPEDILL